MAGLKADLDSYLNNSSSSKSPSISFSNLSKSITLPTLKNPFGSSSNSAKSDDEEALLSDGESGSSSNSGWFGMSRKEEAKTSRCEDCLPALSKKQRIFGFVTCLGLGLFCFSFASVYVPVIVLKARKFALLFSLGSLFTLGSFSFLWGPCNHIRHLVGKERLPFTSIYLGSLAGTLYFALSLQSTILTTIAAICQVLALVWFVVSYIPGGQTGMKFFARICSAMCTKGSSSVLPI